MATPKVKTKQVNMRMPLDLLNRLDRYAERLQEKLPGLSIDRTGALKYLLEKALAAEEDVNSAEAQKPPQVKRSKKKGR